MTRFKIYVGPTLVDTVADRLLRQGFEPVIRGTQTVYVDAENENAVQSALEVEFGTASGFHAQKV